MWEIKGIWYEPIIRAVFIYFLIFITVRILGKKQVAVLTPFDLLLILVISFIIQNGAIGEDHTIKSAVIMVAMLLVLNFFFNEIKFRFHWFEKFLKGSPEVIILNGKVHHKVLHRAKISEFELFESLREHEVMKYEEVKCAILEANGKISVIKHIH